MRELLESEELGDVYIAAITPVEVIAALARCTRDRQVADSAREGIRRFRQALADNVYIMVDLTPKVLDDATKRAETHYLRGYDAVQLATALAVRKMQSEEEDDEDTEKDGEDADTLVVVSADSDLNAAARNEKLSAENPLDHA